MYFQVTPYSQIGSYVDLYGLNIEWHEAFKILRPAMGKNVLIIIAAGRYGGQDFPDASIIVFRLTSVQNS